MTGGMLFYIIYDLLYFFLCLFGGMDLGALIIFVVLRISKLYLEVEITSLDRADNRELKELIALFLDLFYFVLVILYMISLAWSTFGIIHQVYIFDFRNGNFGTIYHFIDFCGMLFLTLIYLGLTTLITYIICFFIDSYSNLKDYGG